MRVLFTGIPVVAAAVIVCLSTCGVAEATVIPVLEDESVVSDMPDENFHVNDYHGGLWTGDDQFGADFRFYLKFALPVFQTGTFVSSATLFGYYFKEWEADKDYVHNIHAAKNDTWSETTITWDNQPGKTGDPVATWDAATSSLNTWYNWDITPLVDQEYQGDGVLSLMFKGANELTVWPDGPLPYDSWESFIEKDHAYGHGHVDDRAFYLDVTVTPEPASLALLLSGGAALLMRRKRR